MALSDGGSGGDWLRVTVVFIVRSLVLAGILFLGHYAWESDRNLVRLEGRITKANESLATLSLDAASLRLELREASERLRARVERLDTNQVYMRAQIEHFVKLQERELRLERKPDLEKYGP